MKEPIERLHDSYKNNCQLRQFFIENYNVNRPIINREPMPPHCDESFQQKTLYFKKRTYLLKKTICSPAKE